MAAKRQRGKLEQAGATNDSSSGLQGLTRALRVLGLFAEDKGLGVRAIGSRLDLSPAVAHRILSTLAAEGFLEQNTANRSYDLGWKIGQLGEAYQQTNGFNRLARQVLGDLSTLTGETAALHVLRNGYRVCLMQHESPQRLRYTMPLNAPMPVTNGATDQVMRAFATVAELAEIHGVVDKATAGIEVPALMGLDSPERLKSDFDSVSQDKLEDIRQLRYERGLGLRESGVGSIATPVRTDTGLFVLTLFGPRERIELADTTEMVSRLLSAAAVLQSNR